MGKVLKVREVGDPKLIELAESIDIIRTIDNDVLDIIEDLKDTLDFYEGFGIAATQVGINKRIIIIKVDKEKCKYNDVEDIPTTIMINPTWKSISDEKTIEYEGCLSVPSIRGKVERYKI